MKKIGRKFCIGIDSGGTKCELMIAELHDDEPKIVFSRKYNGVHYSVSGPEVYSSELVSFIKDALRRTKLSLRNCDGICIGVAGAREDADRKRLSRLFVKKLKFGRFTVTTDAMTALYGAFEGKEGIILISGTGSVLYGYSGGRIKRVGGWGRIIGDEGSGYWIGRKALNLMMKEYDSEVRPPSMLSKIISQKAGINNTNAVRLVFEKNFQIQTLAKIVIECADRRCPAAVSIIEEAASGLLGHISTFLKTSGRKKNIDIAFIGSIIENDNLLSRKLKSMIRSLGIVKVKIRKHSPAYGAVLIASGNTDIISKL